MKYWAVTGLVSARFLGQLEKSLENLDAEPLVVETGDGIGLWKNRRQVVVQETRGVVPFLHKAFEALQERAEPEDWFLRVDADDDYYREYQEVLDGVRLGGAVATAIRDVYLRTEADELWLCCGKGKGAPGGTLAGEIQKSPTFRGMKAPWGEDALWCNDAQPVFRLGTGYVMRRHEGYKHTFPVRGDELPHLWHCEANHLGMWDEAIVRGDVLKKGRTVEVDPVLCMRAVERCSREQMRGSYVAQR